MPPSPTMRPEDFTGNLFLLLDETFEGSHAHGNAFLDRGHGWFATLEDVSAERASRSVAPGGTTVAGHVAHTIFYLDALDGYLTGRITGRLDWSESWRVREVDAEAWDALRRDLAASRRRVCATLERVPAWEDDPVGDALAILAHSAYHLGAVRQMLRAAAT